jgi:hypothetical protein
MNCVGVQKKLLFYLDNELTLKEKQAVESHLVDCPACQEELQALLKTRNLLSEGFQALSSETAPLWSWVELEQRLVRLKEEKVSFIKIRIKSFTSWQPSWKPILSGVLAVVLIISSVVLVPKLTTSSPEVKARDLARDTPEVIALAGGELSTMEAEVSSTMGYVLTSSTSGDSNLAYVDLQKGSVVRLFRITITPLTAEDKAQAVSIAKADLNTQRILESGGTISDIFPLPPRLRLDIIDGQPVIWTEGVLVVVVLKLNNLMWFAKIDLSDGNVLDISMIAAPILTQQTEQPAGSYSKEELIDMAKSDSRVSALLEQGAEVAHAAVGRGKMAMSGAIILKLGGEVWSVSIDLNTHTVTRVELIPETRHSKSNIFIPE